ncbi:MAG: polymer-forming cytoskeletal protein [Patescibacteria group bacterium]|nr:polymer-forming cytoskeletal protein [Patescibacteria group bacterium]
MEKPTKIIFTLVLGVFLLGLPLLVLAADNQSNITVAAGDIIDGNFIRFGSNIQIDGAINGDVLVAGSNIDINGPVAGDIIAFGSNIKINSSVGGSVRAIAPNIEINGEVQRNIWLLSTNVKYGEQATTGWDFDAITSAAELKGKIIGSAKIKADNVVLAGAIAKNADVSLGRSGKLLIESTGLVDGNLIYRAKDQTQLELKDGGKVTGTTERQDLELSSAIDWKKTFNVANLFLQTILFFGLLVIGVIIISLVPKIMLNFSEVFEQTPAKALGWGLVYLMVTPLVSLLLFFTIIGIPLAIILLIGFTISLYLAKILAGFGIGLWLFNKIKGENKYQGSLIWPMVVGLLVVTIIGMIPIIGWAVKFLLILWSLGALLIVKKDILREYR